MRLRFSLSRLYHIAQSQLPGRCPFHQAFVPRCFSPQSTISLPSPVGFVSNYSSHPFFNKTPKYMPKIEKTIKQFITGPPRASPKQPRFLSRFLIFLQIPVP
jgi:hypothetical protein